MERTELLYEFRSVDRRNSCEYARRGLASLPEILAPGLCRSLIRSSRHEFHGPRFAPGLGSETTHNRPDPGEPGPPHSERIA